jgi:Telomere resolvase
MAILSPQEFFNQVIALKNKLEVHRACNQFLEKLKATYTVATISKKLTAYRKLFYEYQHSNSELNESVQTKTGERVQHIAANLLNLSDEQKHELHSSKESNDNARAGINKEGEFREIDKPKTDIEKVVRKSLECLQSDDVYTIACGIINLTGLRANEQNMPKHIAKNFITEREMIVVGKYLIGFKGLSKKRTVDDTNAFFIRPTLAPAQIIFDAHRKFLASPKVQPIPTDTYNYHNSPFKKAFERKYKKLFGEDLSTIEAYDDDGKLIRANGSPHKGRAFYACALRGILKAKNTRDSVIQTYIQLSLAHDNINETIKYLGRYDESDFTNAIDLEIPVNIKEIGKMSTAVIEEIKVTPKQVEKKSTKTTFNVEKFIDGLNEDLQIKFQKIINDKVDITEAVLTLIEQTQAKNNNPQNANKPKVSDEIKTIVAAVLEYNSQQTENTKCIVPTYSLVNKIAAKFLNKSLAKTTVDSILNELNDDITTRLSHKEITGLNLANWNGKYHRKDLDNVIESIVSILNN